MKLLVSLAFAAAAVFAISPSVSFAVDDQISPNCRPGANPVYQRPGGFCEQVRNNKSLAVVSSAPDACDPYSPLYTEPCEE